MTKYTLHMNNEEQMNSLGAVGQKKILGVQTGFTRAKSCPYLLMKLLNAIRTAVNTELSISYIQ